MRHDFWDEMIRQLVDHVAHQARLDVQVEGFAVRTHFDRRLQRVLATKGEDHPDTVMAQQELEGPAAPEPVQYLLRWSWEMYGRSGVSMDGVAPLSYTTIRDWAVLTDRAIDPHEVQALLVLDAVRRNPPKETGDG